MIYKKRYDNVMTLRTQVRAHVSKIVRQNRRRFISKTQMSRQHPHTNRSRAGGSTAWIKNLTELTSG